MLRLDVTHPSPAAVLPIARSARLTRMSRVLARRRLFVLGLNIATIGVLASAMFVLLSGAGWTPLRIGMYATYLITLPWLSIGFWNAVIGVALIVRGGEKSDPLALAYDPARPIVTRTAITMAVRNEDTAGWLARLRTMLADLEATGVADHFDIHVLSDTNDEAIAAEEVRVVEAWRAGHARAAQIHYRRRTDNTGFKAGNLQEFCGRHEKDYTFFLPLDADSAMSAREIVKLVKMMEQNPRVGILQSLVVGTPSTAFFTRFFQFGMRHGMRAYTAGSAWWTGDCGPYWGHNAVIRMAPFTRACKMPVLPGSGPLGGSIMSHDQVEAVMMRRAGYHVRVIPTEGESWEDNPPTLPDFIRRELRWCQGNMQYFKLLGMPGLKPTSRIQLVLAILMYLGAPAWMAFLVFGTASLFAGSGGYFDPVLGLSLFVAVMTMSFAPKLMGVAGLLASRSRSARYGGRLRVLAGAFVELLMSTLMAPVVALAIAVFAGGLIFGRKLDWRAQPRSDREVSWSEAFRSFWPQMLFGAALLGAILATMPAVLPWAVPVIAGLLLAAPLAVWTASPALGRFSVRHRICDIPEDPAPPPTLQAVRAHMAAQPA